MFLKNMPSSSAQKGFTLIELIVSMVLIGIISVGIFSMLATGSKAFFAAEDTSAASEQSVIALERMTRELMEVRNPGIKITSATSTSLTFVNFAGTTVTYSRSGTNLNRTAGSARVLAGNLTNSASGLAFTYFQKDGKTTAGTTAQIYFINISLQFTYTSRGSGTTFTEPVNTTIYLRNAQ